MEFCNLIEARRSVRAFAPQAVTEEQLETILSAANRAPSAGNLQAYEIYVITKAETRSQLVMAAWNQEFIAQAPLVLAFCAHPARSAWRYKQRGVELYTLQDATIACTYAMLAATNLGLGSVWVGAFDEDAVRKAIDAPPEHCPVILLPIGYPGEQPPLRPRRALPELVHYE